MESKLKKGQTFYYMYLNLICKSKVINIHEQNGKIFYEDSQNSAIEEKLVFKTKEQLFNFHSGKK